MLQRLLDMLNGFALTQNISLQHGILSIWSQIIFKIHIFFKNKNFT